MKIKAYLSLKCGSQAELEANLAEALRQEGIGAAISIERLDQKQAADRGFQGSPTVLIEGQAVQPVSVSGFA